MFSNGAPRLIQVKGIDMEAEFAPHMLYVTNEDKPGFIGKLGTLLGDAKVNIANFNLGPLRAAAATRSRCFRSTSRCPDNDPHRNPHAPPGEAGARSGVLSLFPRPRPGGARCGNGQ